MNQTPLLIGMIYSSNLLLNIFSGKRGMLRPPLPLLEQAKLVRFLRRFGAVALGLVSLLERLPLDLPKRKDFLRLERGVLGHLKRLGNALVDLFL